MKKISCSLVLCMLCVQLLCPDTGLTGAKIQLKTETSFPDGTISVFGRSMAPVCDLFFGLHANDSFKMKSVQFVPDSLGLRFTPCFLLYGKQTENLLSFYVGRLNYGWQLKKLANNCFSKVSQVASVEVKNKETLSLSTAQFRSDFGLELHTLHGTIAYLAALNQENEAFDHAMCANIITDMFGRADWACMASVYSGISSAVLSGKEKEKHGYHGGTSVAVVNKYLGVHGDFCFSLNAKKQAGYSGAFYMQNYFKPANLTVAVTAQTPAYVGWKNTYSDNTFACFVIPSFTFGICHLQFYYGVQRTGLKRAEKYTKGAEHLEHSGGGIIELKNEYFKLNTGLDYAAKVVSVDADIGFFAKQAAWFKGIDLGTNLKLQNKKINPYTVQSYQVGLNVAFAPLKEFTINISGKVSQENKLKKVRVNGMLVPAVCWQLVYCEMNLGTDYSFTGTENSKHKFTLDCSFFNKPKYYKLKIGYEAKL